jgi:hypothetical protein
LDSPVLNCFTSGDVVNCILFYYFSNDLFIGDFYKSLIRIDVGDEPGLLFLMVVMGIIYYFLGGTSV